MKGDQDIYSMSSHTTISLIATIKTTRPDLLQDTTVEADPIPELIPLGYMDRFRPNEIPDIGEPMNACFMTGTKIDPSNWYGARRSSRLTLHQVDIRKV